MLNFDQKQAEHILRTLDENGYLFPGFGLELSDGSLKCLGKGGFSSVYEMIHQSRSELHFALKVIGMESHVVTSEEFWTTSRIQAILCEESPNIMRILDARELSVEVDDQGDVISVRDSDSERWEEGGIHLQLVLMEKLSEILGRDRFKNAFLRRDALQDEAEVLRFAMQIGQALALAHSYHILHRDIKLENIFWDEQEQCYKLGDFGIAKLTEEGNAETVVYTDGYGAPEIERRLYESYNVAADIYSFGITLYLLLNDLRFPGSDGYYVRSEIQYHPEFIFPAPAHASEEMTRVVRKMCSYEAEDRYQSMAEVLTALAAVGQADGLREADEFMELADVVTETYREEKKERAEEAAIDKPKTPEERKIDEKAAASLHFRQNIKCLFWLTVLFTLLLKGMQTDTSMITHWMFWPLPMLLLFESVLQRMKEFHIFFGIWLLVFSAYSIHGIGLTVPHILFILCVLMGVPTLSAAGACSTGLWMFLDWSAFR